MAIELQEMYDQLTEAVATLDEQLDSLSDAETAGKRKVTNELVEKYKGTWEAPVTGLVDQLKKMAENNVDEMVGVFNALLRELRSNFNETSDKHVSSIVESQPKTEPMITEAEAKVKSTQRSEAYQQLKSVIELAQAWEVPGSDTWVMPKPRRGARGKRGKRALSSYDWSIDGTQLTGEDNSVTGVYKLLGFDKAKDFTEFLRSNKIETRTPPEEFEVVYGEKTVKAVRQAGAEVPEETTDDTDEPDYDEPEAEEDENGDDEVG